MLKQPGGFERVLAHLECFLAVSLDFLEFDMTVWKLDIEVDLARADQLAIGDALDRHLAAVGEFASPRARVQPPRVFGLLARVVDALAGKEALGAAAGELTLLARRAFARRADIGTLTVRADA